MQEAKVQQNMDCLHNIQRKNAVGLICWLELSKCCYFLYFYLCLAYEFDYDPHQNCAEENDKVGKWPLVINAE